MLFSSWQFIFVFLPITLGVFSLLPSRWLVVNKLWLIFTSVVFYAYWKIEYVPLLLFSMLFNYAVAEGILRLRTRPVGCAILALGVGLNLLLLGYYKYTNFILSFLGQIARHDFGRFDIILPLAISFFTFTQIGYLVDVYRDQTRHYRFLDYAFFVVFFPHLIAGPIVRHWEIIPQFADRELKHNRVDLGLGFLLFLLGLYKKLLIADPTSEFATAVYGSAEKGLTLTCFDSWLGTLAFALQIYFDFSGYSDMAIGLARMFGLKFPGNFFSPYRAGSIIEFWRRWHMTLTRFLREYVYYSLGGNRCSVWRQSLNILATMLLSGLWHGAGWTFVIWGGLHGFLLLVVHRWRSFVKARAWQLRHWAYRTFCVLLTFVVVLFTWVFFRAPTVRIAGQVLASMTGFHGFTAPDALRESGKHTAQVLKVIHARIVPANLPLKAQDYRWALQLLGLLLVLAWFIPNTQQLLAAHEPTIEPVERPARFGLPVNALSGLVCGILFFWVIRGYFVLPQSPFLYFNF